MSPYAGSSDLSGNLVGEPSDPHPQQLSGFQVEREAELFFLTSPFHRAGSMEMGIVVSRNHMGS